MFIQFFENLSPINQGNLLIISGVILLLNSLGIVSLNIIIAVIAVYMIWVGCVKADYINQIKQLIKK